jgi:hypothetical protein
VLINAAHAVGDFGQHQEVRAHRSGYRVFNSSPLCRARGSTDPRPANWSAGALSANSTLHSCSIQAGQTNSHEISTFGKNLNVRENLQN